MARTTNDTSQADQSMRIIVDDDCPSCGWPEVVAVGYGQDIDHYECYKACGWSALGLR